MDEVLFDEYIVGIELFPASAVEHCEQRQVSDRVGRVQGVQAWSDKLRN